MPRIQAPLGMEGAENLPRTKRNLHNVYNSGKTSDTGSREILPRPGIELLASTTRVARGQFVWNEELYQVQSQSLVKITNTTTGANTVIGEITGAETIRTANGFNDCVIVVRGGDIFALSNSTTLVTVTGVTNSGGVARFAHGGTAPVVGNTVTLSTFVTNTAYNVTGIVSVVGSGFFEVTGISFGSDEAGKFSLVLSKISINSNFEACNDVTHINGKFVYIPTSGDPAFFSNVGAAGTVQSTSFFDAEELPDKNNACFNGRNTLFICGTDSIESFRDTGASPNPFTRVTGSRILNGFIGGLLEYQDTFIFIGREKDQDSGIFAIQQGGASKISNERIDLILTNSTLIELKNAIAGRFKWRGRDIATFSIGNNSFAFYNGSWFTLSTIVNSKEVSWSAGFINQFENEYYTAFNNKIGKFSSVNTDYGNAIPRIIETIIEQSDDDFISLQSIQLGVSQGFNSGVKSVALQLSRDNVNYGAYAYKTLGNIGDYEAKVVWNPPGGLGSYEGFIGIRFYTIDDMVFSVDKMIAKVR